MLLTVNIGIMERRADEKVRSVGSFVCTDLG